MSYLAIYTQSHRIYPLCCLQFLIIKSRLKQDNYLQFIQTANLCEMSHNIPLHQRPKVPFLPVSMNWNITNPTYCKMLFQILSPHFTFRSLTFLYILITFLILVITFFISPAPHPTHFLQIIPPKLFILNPELIRRNPLYLYQCFTSLFFHLNFKHWTGCLMVVFLKLSPLEYVYRCSAIIVLFGGFVTNCYIALISDTHYLGFSSTVSSALGMYIGFLIVNWPHLQENYGHMLKPWIGSCMFVGLLLLAGSPHYKFVAINVMSILLGVYMGIAFTPKYSRNEREKCMTVVFSIFTAVIVGLPLYLLIFH